MAAQTARVTIGENGRIVIPAALRRELGMKAGEPVVLRVEDGELRISTVEAALERARRILARYIPPEIDLTQELIDDRRREAAREDLE